MKKQPRLVARAVGQCFVKLGCLFNLSDLNVIRGSIADSLEKLQAFFKASFSSFNIKLYQLFGFLEVFCASRIVRVLHFDVCFICQRSIKIGYRSFFLRNISSLFRNGFYLCCGCYFLGDSCCCFNCFYGLCFLSGCHCSFLL